MLHLEAYTSGSYAARTQVLTLPSDGGRRRLYFSHGQPVLLVDEEVVYVDRAVWSGAQGSMFTRDMNHALDDVAEQWGVDEVEPTPVTLADLEAHAISQPGSKS